MRWLPILLIAMSLPLAACATTPDATYLVDTKGPYQLDAGDTVRVSVYGDEELSDTYKIDDAGAIAFPLVGSVQVKGQTTRAASANLAAALSNGYMRDPNVAVEVTEYRPFFIQGEIGNSGQFPYVFGMTVRSAIAVAGGYSVTANRDYALLYRRQGNKMARVKVNLDFPIFPGDTIVVEERWF